MKSSVLLPCLLTLTACAASPAMRAAERGDRGALSVAVAAKEKRGILSNREAAGLAQVVADRELRAASGAMAIERVRDSASCGHELDGALAARSATHDDGGAEAALVRLEERRLGWAGARAYLGDANPRWRAVGVRALVRAEDHEARVRALLDPDPRVRREAARAAGDARDPRELDALMEAARLDPAPIVRTEAVRAIAGLPSAPDNRVSNALGDLWMAGDEGLREDVAAAWTSPELWVHGGKDAARVLVASEHGPGAVEAAARVLHRPDVDDDMAGGAVAQLARSMEQGATRTRLQALAEAPLNRPALLAVVRGLVNDGDLDIRVGAFARLAEMAEGRARAIAELERLGQPGSPVARRARLALASAGDRRVQAWVEQDLTAEEPALRLLAARALADLGAASRAAPLLADEEARVRTRAACTILLAARRNP